MDEIQVNDGRSLLLRISRSAQKALDKRQSPLFLEMELYFSCLVRKRVYVRNTIEDGAVVLNDKLSVRFRPVVTEQCAMREVEVANPPVKDMPVVNPERYFPHWLTLDYRHGDWIAEFGYASVA